jgi:hypothetical protein
VKDSLVDANGGMKIKRTSNSSLQLNEVQLRIFSDIIENYILNILRNSSLIQIWVPKVFSKFDQNYPYN